MELGFTPQTLQYMRMIHRDRQTREETLDTIVPDSYPDVDRIVFSHASVVMRSKECRAGSVTISGGIRANVMYVAEGEKMPRTLEVYLPYTVKSESPELTDHAEVLFRIWVRSVDARMVNSRKIMVRVNLCYTITAYEQAEETLFELKEVPQGLQTKKVEYSMLFPAETAERSFQMTEEIKLPANRPLTGEVYRFHPRLEITERRLAGNKAVFKGLCHLHMLYGTADDKLAAYDAEIPFSQYCDLRDLYDEEDLSLELVMTGCEVDRTAWQDGEGILLTLHILAQCLVSKRETLCFTEDAYAINGELQPQWKPYAFTDRLDKQMLSRTVRDSWEGGASDVVDSQVYLDHPHIAREETGAQITVPACVQVLYYDQNGDLQGLNMRSELKEEIALNPGADCAANACLGGDAAVLPAAGGIELRYPVALTVESSCKAEYRTLCGGQIQEMETRRQNRPAVIVRRMRSGERLWDIAKANGTTVERIRSANPGDPETMENGVILIPI